MVLYFMSNVVSPPYCIYMGEDKHENEDLIKYGWPEDIWFHVDKLSSAHVYLRLHQNETIDMIPQSVLDDCAQLVKANSIQGNKQNNLDIVYTPWSNLKKTANMEVGQVGFHKQKEVKTMKIEKRINEIVNRLNKTLVEKKPDLKQEKDERDRNEREKKKEMLREDEKKKREVEEEKKRMAELKSYDRLMKTENMTSNHEAGYDSDDFM